MEETAQNPNPGTQFMSVEEKAPEVGFPISQPKPKAKGTKWLFIFLAVVIVAGGIIFLVSRSNRSLSTEESPTPYSETLSTPESTFSPTPSATPADRATIKIEVQNGTGITGEAAYLQGQLKSLGYTNIKAGNSSVQDSETTVVTYGKNLSQAISDEITAKLNELYKEVEVKTSSTQTMDVVVVTGLRKGSTAKPSPTVTIKASSSPTASSSVTATPTPTATTQ